MFTAFYKKTEDRISKLPPEWLLNQPQNEVLDFFNLAMEKDLKYNLQSFSHPQIQINKMQEFTSLYITNKSMFMECVSDFFAQRHYKDKNILQTLENVDMILKLSNPKFSNFMEKEFGIKSQGIDAIFDSLEILLNNFKKYKRYTYMNLEEFKIVVKEPVTIYRKMKLEEMLETKDFQAKPVKV